MKARSKHSAIALFFALIAIVDSSIVSSFQRKFLDDNRVASELDAYTTPSNSSIAVSGKILDDKRVLVDMDAPELKNVLFMTKSMRNLALDRNTVTVPVSKGDGTGVLMLRGVPLTIAISSRWSYERTVCHLIHGSCKEASGDTVKVKVFMIHGARTAMAMLVKRATQDQGREDRYSIKLDPVSFLVSSLRSLYRGQELGIESLKTAGPKILGSIAGIVAYMNRCLNNLDLQSFKVPTYHVQSFIEYFATIALGSPTGTAEHHEFVLRSLNQYLVMLIGHGMNLSTSVLLQAISGGGDAINLIDIALRTLDTPNHGRAATETYSMLERISIEYDGEVESFLSSVQGRKEVLYGFGHRIYKSNTDPRAVALEAIAMDIVANRTVAMELADKIMLAKELELAARDNSFVKERGLQPNVDYWAPLVLKGLGIHPRLATCMFGTSRAGSWIADMLHAGKLAIQRPQDKPFEMNALQKSGLPVVMDTSIVS